MGLFSFGGTRGISVLRAVHIYVISVSLNCSIRKIYFFRYLFLGYCGLMTGRLRRKSHMQKKENAIRARVVYFIVSKTPLKLMKKTQ